MTFEQFCNITPNVTTAPPDDTADTATSTATTTTTTTTTSTTTTTIAPTTAPPVTCNDAMIALRQNQRCFNLTATIDSSTITTSDCTACRTLFETVVTACGSTVRY